MKANGKITNLENIFLFLFLLLIPTQLGKHFWPEWSLVRGVRIDYLSPILYLVDIVWGLWVGTKLIKNYPPRGLPKGRELKIKNWKNVLSFQNIIVGMFILLNILVAGSRWVAIYRWIRIGQWLISYKIIKNSKLKIKNYLGWVIPWWIGMESILGWAQMVKGGSLNGIWYWLGERRFDFSSIGVAQISISGNGLTRAYGTFSHPNSLAGFLLISLLMWKRYQKKVKSQKSKVKEIIWWVVFWLGVVGIIVTGSRTVWGLGIAIIIYNLKFIIYNLKKTIGCGAIAVGVVMLILGIIGVNYKIGDFVGGWDSDGLAKRVNLNVAGMKMWKDNFPLGIGAGNFISKLPEYQDGNKFYWLQPIHNIFLLTGAEIGMLGVILMAKFIIFNFKFINKRKNYLVLGVIVVTGMVDHYWVTLPQNSWLLAVVLAIM